MEEKKNELNNEELEKVNGGWSTTSKTYATEAEVVFKWNVGDHVEKVCGYAFGHVFTCGCTVIERMADKKPDTDGCCAKYRVSSSDGDYNGNWYYEYEFEHGYDMIYHELVM